jgi:hypothetical protein
MVHFERRKFSQIAAVESDGNVVEWTMMVVYLHVALCLLAALSSSTASAQSTSGPADARDFGTTPYAADAGIAMRTAARRANDNGFSVLESGAACDGATDDAPAIAAAIASGNSRITIPVRTCYVASGITVPPGVTLAGISFSPGNPPSGSTILCASGVAKCVTLGNGSNVASRLEDLVVATNAINAPTAVGVFVNGGYNVTIDRVMVYNVRDAFYWKADRTIGLGGRMRETYAGRVADAHIVQDSWPELRISDSRFGMNGVGDLAAMAFIRITGGYPHSQAGPNTLEVVNTQFNQGAIAVAHWLQFTNCAGTCIGGSSPTNSTEFRFSNVHVENLSADFVTSDPTWNAIAYFGIANSVFGSAVPFWTLNAATSLANSQITGNYFESSTWALAPTPQFNGVIINGNSFHGPVSITSNSPHSTLSFNGNAVFGNITFAGPWQSFSAVGDNVSGGKLKSTATGNVYVGIPAGNIMR